MLTTNKTSRTRLVSGVAAIAMLTVAGLGFTASGTRAAAAMRDNVETATGVNLASLNIAPPAPPAAPVPPLPPVPPVPMQAEPMPAPPAPPAPPEWSDGGSRSTTTTRTTTTDNDGKTFKHVRIIRRGKDGQVQTEDFEGLEALKNMPEVSSINCGEGGDRRDMVINKKDGDKHKIIICRNRIERVAREGAAVAMNSRDIQRNAYQSALSGLRSARENMTRNVELSGIHRAEALKAMDEAIREVEQDMAKVD